jgi:uncharacterized C2H2 Zn-finger protein
MDPETGILVKQEPLDSKVVDDYDFSLALNSRDEDSLAGVEVSFKQEPHPGSSLQADVELMPPPASGTPPPSRQRSKSSKNKIFKCCECHRAFKQTEKLVKHVEKKHSGKKRKKKAEAKPETETEGPPSNDLALVKTEIPEAVASACAADKEDAEKPSLKLSPMGCPDCNQVLQESVLRTFFIFLLFCARSQSAN